MAARKTTARKPPASAECPVCKGAGEVAIPVKVGRSRRETEDQQLGMCLTCLGSGQDPASEE
jgi:hypothetical protein